MKQQPTPSRHTRRDFLKDVAAITTLAAGASVATTNAQDAPAAPQSAPWHRRTYRWGQTNITEIDPARYDIAWWRQQWKRTAIQGVIINAGGIYAYYPSKYPLHHRAQGLGDRDTYGDLARAAHDDGLVVLARMDSNRVHEEMFRAHPDWIAMNANGQPYRAGAEYVTCVNGPYYDTYLPDILREIIERSKPEGFTDNSWSGLDRGSICNCPNCAKRFRDHSGKDLPRAHNWNDQAYRDWIVWSYARRVELWDFNNKVTQAAGGKDCLWLGMNGGGISGQARAFREYKQICARTPMIMLDHQSRGDLDGFQSNALVGKLIHGLLGWDKLIPESMPMYQMGRPTFRLSSKPPAEAQMWMLDGFAGGIQPWWHHISAYQEDRRMYKTAAPVMNWHAKSQRYLVDRTPLASVGIVWSQQNTDFFGRDNPDERVDQPFRGIFQALVRARIPHIPVHIDHIERDAPKLSTLILPNIGAMSDAQVASVRRFVEQGGSLIATGQTSLFNEWGDPRADFALADVLGVSGANPRPLSSAPAAGRARTTDTLHTYLRLTPELRGQVDGPKSGDEPPISGTRHPILAGFDETDILPFGGALDALKVNAKAKVLLTFIPAFPMFPPETAWMRTPRTDIAGLVVNEFGRGKSVYFAADIDRRFAIDNLPDHGDLLANAVRWSAGDSIPLQVTGHGLIDCELYEQPGRLILHVVNLTSAATWRAPIDELIAVGPCTIKVKLPTGLSPKSAKLLVSESTSPARVEGGWVKLELKSILDHEVVVIE
ncbi:MAG TPA: twin-arginine translocation signal domain-containing protein [Humisphaera sp.]|jgi:hypothetical protein|nr:twin-arginine translocation signal domain-containing protein [Humisphaera sp.]